MDTVKFYPLAGWGTAASDDGIVILEVTLVPDDAALTDGRRQVIRIQMQAEQAEELADGLERAAQHPGKPAEGLKH